jgi:hypothetical protein
MLRALRPDQGRIEENAGKQGTARRIPTRASGLTALPA